MNDGFEFNPYVAPAASLIEEKEVATLVIYKKLSVWLVIFFNIVTLGIYSYIWIYIRTNTINLQSKNKISKLFVFSVLYLYVGTWVLDVVIRIIPVPIMLFQVNAVFNVVVWALHVAWLFLFKSRLELLLSERKMIGLHVSGIMTFLFGSVYLQYKINEGLEAVKLNDDHFAKDFQKSKMRLSN